LFYVRKIVIRGAAFCQAFPPRLDGAGREDYDGPKSIILANRVMKKTTRDFQVFVKAQGAACNLACDYCYYLSKSSLYSAGGPGKMPEDLLETYIAQHIEASPAEIVRFSWHGGEPTLLGLDYFRRIAALQRWHQPPGRTIVNGIQTNGTLLSEDWCRFLADEGYTVGLSLDGPEDLHDLHRRDKGGRPTHALARRGFDLLQERGVPTDILCVLSAQNVGQPERVYRFFKGIGVTSIGFLPLVEPRPEVETGVSPDTVPAEAFGDFLCTVFEEWKVRDIGQVKVEMFEEAARTAFDQEPAVCVFRPTCGDVPMVERNGDVYACDHFVDAAHLLGNIRETHLARLLECPEQRAFGRAKADALPRVCRACEVLSLCNGGCLKDRFVSAPDGEAGLNFLCAGYKRFFTHVRPFVSELAALWRANRPQPEKAASKKVGRNDPCPCGSGLKYKKCCLNKKGGFENPPRFRV